MERSTSLWSIGPSVYLPSVLFSIGQGAVLPVIALSAVELGASFGEASAVMAALGTGRVAFSIPAGSMASRFGERNAMLVAVTMMMVAMTGCVFAPSVPVFAFSAFLAGCSWAAWGVARQTFIAEAIALEMRARAYSLLGGLSRFGSLAGPFAGAGAVSLLGTDGSYWLGLTVAVLSGALLLSLPNVAHHEARDLGQISMARVFRENLPVLARLGLGVTLLSASRIARQVAVPLWASHLGMDTVTTLIIVGISGSAELVSFYPGGIVMDRVSRAAVAIPSLLVMGVAYLCLPFTHNELTLTLVAVTAGLGNGISSGFNMTLGADTSPTLGRAKFLGLWRFSGDLGDAFGPFLIGVAAGSVSLGFAIASMGGVAFLGAAVLAHWLPTYGHRTDGL